MSTEDLGSDDIMFLIKGDGINEENPENSNFALNPFSGELFLIRPLDCDPPDGRQVFELEISAEDGRGRPLDGVVRARIRVINVNDNYPQFSREVYSFSLKENNPEGAVVGGVVAVDADGDRVEYEVEVNRVDARGRLMFGVDRTSGKVFANVCCLLSEISEKYLIKVCAFDAMHKNCCHVTINVVKEEKIEFNRKEIFVRIPEIELKKGKIVTEVGVTALAVNRTHELEFRVQKTNTFSEFFTILTKNDNKSEAFLMIAKDMNQVFKDFKEIPIMISVSNHRNSNFIDFCKINIFVVKTETKPVAKGAVSTARPQFTPTATPSIDMLSEIQMLSLLLASITITFLLIIIISINFWLKRESRDCIYDSAPNYESFDSIGRTNEEGGEVENKSYDLWHLRVKERNIL